MLATATIITVIAVILVIWLLVQSIRTVRPTSRALIERFGKYNRFANPGIIFLIPFIEHLIRVNITENMIDAGLQEIITSDSLNAQVDAQVYFLMKRLLKHPSIMCSTIWYRSWLWREQH
jgi:regulator of protease activity HflC (stomatin/prohibitin superfamily)